MVAAVLAYADQQTQTVQIRPPHCSYNGSNTLDNSGVQDIMHFDVKGIKRLVLEISNITNNLAAFVVQGAPNQQAPWITIASLSTDYTVPKGLVIGASGDLTALAAGATGWIILDVEGFSDIKIQANSSAAGGSTLTFYGGGNCYGSGI